LHRLSGNFTDKNKGEAIDIVDIMRYCSDLEDGPEYTVSLDIPLEKLKTAIERL